MCHTKVLKGYGFKLHPYEQCVANKKIHDKQCTIACYVDANFASHDGEDLLESIVDLISKHFGKLTITR